MEQNERIRYHMQEDTRHGDNRVCGMGPVQRQENWMFPVWQVQKYLQPVVGMVMGEYVRFFQIAMLRTVAT